MSRSYTKKEIAHLLDVSLRTIAEDAKFLNIEPTIGDRGLKLFNQQNFNLISQMREHCADKSKTRESFVPKTEIEIVEDLPQVSKLSKYAPSTGGGEPDAESASTLDIYQKSIDYGREADPLFDLVVLQRISDNCWLLPTARLAPLLDISKKQLNRYRQYYFCGFVVTKEIRIQGKTLWKVSANNGD